MYVCHTPQRKREGPGNCATGVRARVRAYMCRPRACATDVQSAHLLFSNPIVRSSSASVYCISASLIPMVTLIHTLMRSLVLENIREEE